MSPSHPVVLKAPDDEALRLPGSVSRLARPLLVGGGAALFIGWLIGLAGPTGLRYAMSAYLLACLFCVTISLGCLFFVMIHHLTRAGWSTSIRRVAELYASAMPLLAIMFVPVLVAVWIGGNALYEWRQPEFMETEMGIAKAPYLNPVFFTIRAVVCFACWIMLSRFFCGNSKLQDETGEIAISERLQFWSGPGVILFALTASVGAFDWVMSLAPLWFSTMFGVYIFAGSILSAIAVITLTTFLLQSRGKLKDEVSVEHYHDLAKYLFGFIVFWTYISFSQFMLIWYANIPEETEWFWIRQSYGWATVSIVLIFMHWLLPFLALMSRNLRRTPKWVAGWAAYIILMHFVDLFWAIMPQTGYGVPPLGGGIGIVSVLFCGFGMFGLYLGYIIRSAADTSLVPARDPRLPESIAFHNI